MPLVPIEMPSLTPIVLNRIPTMPAACTPFFTSLASSCRCMLQVCITPQSSNFVREFKEAFGRLE